MLPMLLPAPPQLEASLDQRPEHVAIEGLLDEVEGRASNRPHQLLVQIVDAAGHQDDVQLAAGGTFSRAISSKPSISGIRMSMIARSGLTLGGDQPAASFDERRSDARDATHPAHARPREACPARRPPREFANRLMTCCAVDCAAACGNVMSTRVPLTGLLSIAIVPSTSQRMERQIEQAQAVAVRLGREKRLDHLRQILRQYPASRVDTCETVDAVSGKDSTADRDPPAVPASPRAHWSAR